MFNFKRKSEKGDKDAKESKKEEKRKREKDRKARNERTLSGREMAGFIAHSRGIETNNVKPEKHGIFRSSKTKFGKNSDFSESNENSYRNGQTIAENEQENGAPSVLSRVSAFENLQSSQAGFVRQSSENYQNASESRSSRGKSGSLSRSEDFQRVQTKTSFDQVDGHSEGHSLNNNSYNKLVIEPSEIESSQVVLSENTDDSYVPANEPSRVVKPPIPPKIRQHNAKRSSSTTHHSSLVVNPSRNTSVKTKRAVDVLPPSERTLENNGISLVLPAVKPVGEEMSRYIKLKRQTNGGFGFALRRSTTNDNKEIYLAEPVAEAYATCLLPGDKLLEVNGHNVENLSREKIVNLVASSGSEVELKVVPIPELAELTVRSGLDGGRLQVDETFIRSGSLARSGSKRIKKKASKNTNCIVFLFCFVETKILES